MRGAVYRQAPTRNKGASLYSRGPDRPALQFYPPEHCFFSAKRNYLPAWEGVGGRRGISAKIQKREGIMGTISKELSAKIKSLPDNEKIELIDSILMQLDKPDPEIDRIWAEEAKKRWKTYKVGKAETVSYEQVMKKHSAR